MVHFINIVAYRFYLSSKLIIKSLFSTNREEPLIISNHTLVTNIRDFISTDELCRVCNHVTLHGKGQCMSTYNVSWHAVLNIPLRNPNPCRLRQLSQIRKDFFYIEGKKAIQSQY